MKVSIKSITTKHLVKHIAEFARVSRNRDMIKTTDDKDLARCKQLWKDYERTPFESISITFLIENVSRSLLAQITRYRLMLFNVQSQRHIKVKSVDDFIMPDAFNNSIQSLEFNSAMNDSLRHYNRLIELGAKVEDARSVLPNATATRFRVVMNLREFFHFYEQRTTLHAQAEIRKLAGVMLKLLYDKVDDISHNLLSFMEESLQHTLKSLIGRVEKLDHTNIIAEELYDKIMDIVNEYKEYV